ncbi:MAG: T9SS type A sorting domain-containing protein, partial [Flavobacteriales bacterium]|nr:T9SS type A sorting domain-containing protein [Flavobacteriales bacterium]
GGNSGTGGSGCMDAKASNYNASATTQAVDQYGNILCVYTSCNDIPEPGCIYSNGFGAFVDGGFSAGECTNYGGTPCATVGIFETQTSVATIYPNPANNFITITDVDFTSVEVYNLTGQIVQINNSNSKVIEISTLPIGVYTLKITDINGNLSHSKLIKK